jgi:hypothetical protein
MNCPNCGQEIQAGDGFCVNCGSPVKGGFQQKPKGPSNFFSSPAGIALVAIVAIVVVAGIVIGVLLATRNDEQPGQATKQENQEASQSPEDRETTSDNDQEANQSAQDGQQPPQDQKPLPAPDNQTPGACYDALLEFAKQSAVTGDFPIDPNSVRLDYFGMESPTLGGAGAYGISIDYGVEELMGAAWAEYVNGTWVCWWEQN